MAKPRRDNPYAKCDGLDHGTAYGILTEKQALTQIYQRLDPYTMHVYSMCKLCRKYHTGIDRDGKPRAIQGQPLWFYFNRSIQQKYGLLNPNRVRKSMIELVLCGFIDVVEYNANTRQKNIYCYSDKWQRIEHGEPLKLSNTALAFIQGKSKEPIKTILAVYRKSYKWLY